MGEQSEPGNFPPNHTHFSKYTHSSHLQITRSCTLHADHSSIPSVYHMSSFCKLSLSQKNVGGGGGGAGVFGGEASPPPPSPLPSPPIDETLQRIASWLSLAKCKIEMR